MSLSGVEIQPAPNGHHTDEYPPRVVESEVPTSMRVRKRNGAHEPVDVNKSYRFEQGFTFELNLMGVSDELRDDFAGTEKSKK